MSNFKKYLLKSKNGFSMIMVLVSVAILGLLAMAFSEMILGAFKGQKNVQNAVDFDVLKTSINMVLNTKACDNAFKNNLGTNVSFSFPSPLSVGTNVIPVSTPVPIKKILQGNSTIAESGTNIGGGMSISKLEFSDAIYDGDQMVGSTLYKAFVATLNLEMDRQSKSYGYSKTFSVRLLLNPNMTNTSGVVEKCGSVDSIARGVVVFSTPGSASWTVPGGTSKIKVKAWGAGGGGGSGLGGAIVAGVAGTAGAGAGGGGYVEGLYSVNAGDIVSIQVGTGGNSGVNGSDGSPGGASTVSVGAISLANAGGGSGGSGWNTGNATGAPGGSAVGGNILNQVGHFGQCAIPHSDGHYRCGIPGGCYGVNNGMPYGFHALTTPSPTTQFCQGGYGSSTGANAAHSGGSGRVVIEW